MEPQPKANAMSANKHPTCGNCDHFIRIKTWGGQRNGMCGKHDSNSHTDSRLARRCESYQRKHYSRTTIPTP
jgi:hypothetical protein